MPEHRVVGPPGTGKTTFLTRQCQIAAQKYGAGGIAIASLTRAAAKEIGSRGTGVPEQNIGTLHAHAYRRMNRPALCETTEGVKDWNEKCGNPGWRLSRQAVANPENASSAEDGVFGTDDTGDGLLAEIGVLRAQMRDERLWPHRVLGFWKKWCEWKTASGRMDFTDLIVRAISDVPSLGVDVMMLDEAQDMSRLEMELARRWGNECESLVVCGDPDQNLYEWRGSDPDAFYAADASSTRVLAQSYRVPRAVHAAAVSWINQIPTRIPAEYFPTEDAGKVVRHQLLGAPDGDALCTLVEQLSEDGSSVMVLTSCGYMLDPLIAAMKQRGIPFHNPYRVANGRWNPLVAAKRLLAFLRPDSDTFGAESRMWTWDEVRMWTEPMLAKGVIQRGMKAVIERNALGGRFDAEEDRIIQNLSDVLKCFEEDQWESVYARSIDWWYEHLKHADQKRMAYVCRVANLRGARELLGTPRVVVGTIHSVKGGEADKVVLSPDLSRAGGEDWNGRGRDAIVRMFYVGMTRARKELHIIGQGAPEHVAL